VREYELTFVIQPEISDEGSQTILSKLDGILASSGAIRLLCDDLGKRKLAYEIRKFFKGHYYMLSFLDGGKVVPDLERALRLEESVLRYLTILANDEVEDIEARKVECKEREADLKRRAAEKAAREADEAKARAEAERRDEDDDEDDDDRAAVDDDDRESRSSDDDDDDEEDDR
jgi:small subunit ribosomal protein S6